MTTTSAAARLAALLDRMEAAETRPHSIAAANRLSARASVVETKLRAGLRDEAASELDVLEGELVDFERRAYA